MNLLFLTRAEFLLRNWHATFSRTYTIYLIQYALCAGLTFVAFYFIFRRLALPRKIQAALPKGSDIRREVSYSMISIGIFAGMGVLVLVLKRLGWTQFYSPVDRLGWGYFAFSVAALIFLHDTWFYWSHRFMHWAPIYKRVHRVHHLSHNPTPWAAFSFHPLEAMIEGMIFPLAVLILPVTSFAWYCWTIYMVLMNVMGHLGFEILPKGFASHRFLRWHNTSVHHNMHHRYFRCNYGLYFNIWDRLMGTNHPNYEEQYLRITSESAAERENDVFGSREFSNVPEN
jgi:lathosterol oxidase